MAEKIACGYFYCCAIKKQLIPMAPARDGPDGRKNSLRLFLLLRNKNNLFLWPRPGTGRMAEKIACGYFYCCAIKTTYSYGPGPGRAGWPKK